MPDSAPLPALPMPRGVLQASMISASAMVLSSGLLICRICGRSWCNVNSPRPAVPTAARRLAVANPGCLSLGILDDQIRLCAAIFHERTKIPTGRNNVTLRRAIAGYGFLVASVALAQAAEPVKLRVADSFPKGHYLVKLILEPWMAEVTKRTNG